MDGRTDGRGDRLLLEKAVYAGVLLRHEKGYSDIYSNIGEPAQENKAAGPHPQEAPGVRGGGGRRCQELANVRSKQPGTPAAHRPVLKRAEHIIPQLGIALVLFDKVGLLRWQCVGLHLALLRDTGAGGGWACGVGRRQNKAGEACSRAAVLASTSDVWGVQGDTSPHGGGGCAPTCGLPLAFACLGRRGFLLQGLGWALPVLLLVSQGLQVAFRVLRGRAGGSQDSPPCSQCHHPESSWVPGGIYCPSMEAKCGLWRAWHVRSTVLRPAWTMWEDSYPKLNKARTDSMFLSPFTRGKEKVRSSKVILSYIATSRLSWQSTKPGLVITHL